MTALLDVNVLIALVDPHHVSHRTAHDWFASNAAMGWATSPITENGLLRILGRPSYPNSPGPPSAVMENLENLRDQPGHRFWADDLSVLDGRFFHRDRFQSSARVTDSYLLALAVSKEGRLATLDRKLSTDGVIGGARALTLIDPAT